jgi:hypothetical protein
MLDKIVVGTVAKTPDGVGTVVEIERKSPWPYRLRYAGEERTGVYRADELSDAYTPSTVRNLVKESRQIPRRRKIKI